MSFQEKMKALVKKEQEKQEKKNEAHFERFYASKIKEGQNILWQGEEREIWAINRKFHIVHFKGGSLSRMQSENLFENNFKKSQKKIKKRLDFCFFFEYNENDQTKRSILIFFQNNENNKRIFSSHGS